MSLGVDIVYLPRLKKKLDQFAEKILSLKEYQEFLKRENKLEYLGGRIAAKEAFLKANGKKLFEIDFKMISILNDCSGMPHIMYNEKEDFEVSISHDRDYAIAVVQRK